MAFSSTKKQGKKRMKFSESLKKNKDFQVVYRRGKSYGNRYLVMYVLKNDLGKNRVGISVSKKVGKAVVRNRVRRLIKESYRLSESSIKKGFDIVIVSRVKASFADFFTVNEELLNHLKKADLISEECL